MTLEALRGSPPERAHVASRSTSGCGQASHPPRDSFLSGAGTGRAGGDEVPCLSPPRRTATSSSACQRRPIQNATWTHFSLIFPSASAVQRVRGSSLAFTYRWQGGRSRHGKRAVATGAETRGGEVFSRFLCLLNTERREK